MYLPSIGLFLGLSQAVAQFLERPALWKFQFASLALAFVIAFGLGVQTYQHNEIWRDDITFLTNTFTYEPSTSAAHLAAGNAYFRRDDYDHAIEQYRISKQILDRLPMVYNNLAIALFARKQPGDVDEALDNAKHALILGTDPVYAGVAHTAYEILASIFEYKGDKTKAGIFRSKAGKKDEL